MVVPANFDAYRLYYEGRAYYAAPFRTRPGDSASVVASYTAFSQAYLHNLAAAGKPYWRSSNSVTGSYTARLARGTYLDSASATSTAPASTPRPQRHSRLPRRPPSFFSPAPPV